MAETSHPEGGHEESKSRRDFLYLTTGSLGAIGVAAFAWPFIDYMNPAADVLALASIQVDLSAVEEGQAITVMWRGRPVFVRHRTGGEIAAAEAADLGGLPDPQADSDRVQDGYSQWLVVVGICTHLGCVPLGQRPTDPRGEFGGWFCPCHGSHYDTSGRVRLGPAPTNLPVPEYSFMSDNRITIG